MATSNMAEALLELQNREERCHKLFEGQIALINKTVDVLDKLDCWTQTGRVTKTIRPS